MKNISILLSAWLLALILFSCNGGKDDIIEANFKDMEKYTLFGYILENDSAFSSFRKILEAGELSGTVSAYNPYSLNYTLFLPDNNAVNDYISENKNYSSLEQLLADKTFCRELGLYHIVNSEIESNEFPFGALPEPSLSGDFLTVGFVFGQTESYYKINNQARVTKANIETSNGIIHIIGSVLKPITYTTKQWLEQNSGYSIFNAAVEATGLSSILNYDSKLSSEGSMVTLLLEPDSIYLKENIKSFDDLKSLISPDRTDYTNPENPLNRYVGYHILESSNFLDYLQARNTNYTTKTVLPVGINGLGLDIIINKGDTLKSGVTSPVVDNIKIFYDQSNISTLTGAIHLINRVMKPFRPSNVSMYFSFWEESGLSKYKAWDRPQGTYLLEEPETFKRITWSGADLMFVKASASDNAWDDDYLLIFGTFTMTYRVPKVVQGKYNVYFRANGQGAQNAIVEIFLDGKKMGGLIDLTNQRNAYPYANVELGVVDFTSYEEHLFEVKSVIPGRMIWDGVFFEPVKN